MAEKKRFMARIGDARERHRERHRPTGYDFALADRIRYLRAEDWDAVAAGASLFLSRRYLEALERAAPKNLMQRYALVFRGGNPVAAVAMQMVSISAGDLRNTGGEEAPAGERGRAPDGAEKKKAKKAPANPLKKLRAKVLVCGNLLSWGSHGVVFAPGQDPSDLWPAVAEALYRVRRAERLSGQTSFVMVKDLHEETCGGIASLERFSFRPFETEPNMVLELPDSCASYEGYLGLLTAKYRKKAKKVHEALDAAGCTVEPLLDLDPFAERIHDLYNQVARHAKVRLVALSPQYLTELARALSEDFRCTVVRRGETLLGFVTTLKDGDTAIAYYIGFDREENDEIPVYFRLLHAAVADALELGCRRVSFGRTALEVKATLGARPVPFRCWLRHRIPLMNLVVRHLLGAIPHDEAPERGALKE